MGEGDFQVNDIVALGVEVQELIDSECGTRTMSGAAKQGEELERRMGDWLIESCNKTAAPYRDWPKQRYPTQKSRADALWGDVCNVCHGTGTFDDIECNLVRPCPQCHPELHHRGDLLRPRIESFIPDEQNQVKDRPGVRQHVSDGVRARCPSIEEWEWDAVEECESERGIMRVTTDEWDALQERARVAEAVARANQAMANDAIDVAISAQKELTQLKEVMRNDRAGSTVRPTTDAVTRAAHAKHAVCPMCKGFPCWCDQGRFRNLFTLAEPDARLGRGNVAMEDE